MKGTKTRMLPAGDRALYFAARWENTGGEKGPWSEIEETSIP
jgi:hypothetical protein